MRKTMIVTSFLILAWVGYMAWPVYALFQLTRAVERGDVATVVAHVDFASLRVALSDQITDTYLELTGKRVSPLLRGLASSAGAIADPIVGRIVTPEALTELLRTGWPKAVDAQPPPGTAGLSRETLGTLWQIFVNTDYGIRRFEIAVPTAFPGERQFGFRFRLVQWRWKLSNVRLPQNVRVLLAEALIRAASKPPR